MRRFLDLTGEFLKCQFCGLKFLTALGHALHEDSCKLNPKNLK